MTGNNSPTVSFQEWPACSLSQYYRKAYLQLFSSLNNIRILQWKEFPTSGRCPHNCIWKWMKSCAMNFEYVNLTGLSPFLFSIHAGERKLRTVTRFFVLWRQTWIRRWNKQASKILSEWINASWKGLPTLQRRQGCYFRNENGKWRGSSHKIFIETKHLRYFMHTPKKRLEPKWNVSRNTAMNTLKLLCSNYLGSFSLVLSSLTISSSLGSWTRKFPSSTCYLRPFSPGIELGPFCMHFNCTSPELWRLPNTICEKQYLELAAPGSSSSVFPIPTGSGSPEFQTQHSLSPNTRTWKGQELKPEHLNGEKNPMSSIMKLQPLLGMCCHHFLWIQCTLFSVHEHPLHEKP